MEAIPGRRSGRAGDRAGAHARVATEPACEGWGMAHARVLTWGEGSDTPSSSASSQMVSVGHASRRYTSFILFAASSILCMYVCAYSCMHVMHYRCVGEIMRRREQSQARRCGSRTREHRAHARGRVCACSACPPDGASLRLRRLLQLELIGHARDVVGRHSALLFFFAYPTNRTPTNRDLPE